MSHYSERAIAKKSSFTMIWTNGLNTPWPTLLWPHYWDSEFLTADSIYPIQNPIRRFSFQATALIIHEVIKSKIRFFKGIGWIGQILL